MKRLRLSQLSFLATVLFATGATTAPPSLPVFEWNRCPFEGCTYREWKAVAPMTLYSTWKTSRKHVGALAPGERVVAITGVVITYKPGVVRVNRDFEEFKRGDRILTYAYHGEGEATAWYKGRLYDAFDISFAADRNGSGCGSECSATYIDEGQKEWWAHVRLRSGRTAWVWMDHAQFDGVDALG
jgi:hypothetical protein